MSQSQNDKIKEFVRSQISRGSWQVGQKIPSEYQLSTQFGVSRMTVNRALRELTMEGRISRVQGVGSFVEHVEPQAPLFDIQSIRVEIESRGQTYSCQIIKLQEEQASTRIARRMAMEVGQPVFFLEALHLSDGVPLQLERRFVRPDVAPKFLQQNFQDETASDYLMGVQPFSTTDHIVEHTVSAIIPDAKIAQKLVLDAGTSCLQLNRRTLIDNTVFSETDFIYPGASFQLFGRFAPLSNAGRKLQ